VKCRIGRGKVGAAKAVFRYGWKQSRGELEPFLRPGEWEPPQWPYQLSRPLVRWSGSRGVKKRATCTKVVNVRNGMVLGDKFREHRRHRLPRPTAAAWTTLPSSCIPRRPYFDLRRGHWLSQIRPHRPFRRRTAGLVRHFWCLDHGPVQEEIELTPCESEGLSGPLTPPLPSPHFSAAGARWGCADLRSQGRRLARVREAYGACGRGDCHDLGGDGEWWGWLGSSDGLPGSAVGKVRRKKGRMGRRTRRGGKELERGEEVMIC